MNLDSLRTETGELTPIESCLNTWHQCLNGDADALDRILADDVVLHSPVLFKPIDGKDLVKLYLTGAALTFVGLGAFDGGPSAASGDAWDGRFRYVRKVLSERDAILEFETTMGGKYVNGVDMITCDDAGQIVDFKVMVRPRQAVEAVSKLMSAALDTLQESDR
jgi:hypothetical protein